MAVRITKKDRKAEREPLFYLGDDTYEIDKEIPARVAVQYLRDLRGGSADVAVARVMHTVVGEAGMKALAESEDLDGSELKQITDIVVAKVLAAVEQETGNSSGRPSR